MKKRFLTTVNLFLLASLPAVAQQPIYPLDDLERGQKGWGLSVFAGVEPVRFEVEVVGVHRNRKPELSYILARLRGQDLERSGVFGGMSGSPVYFDGRLLGAVAYSYPFDMDALAGITPIEAMRRLNHAPQTPLPGEFSAAALPASPVVDWEELIGWEKLVRREFAPDLFEKHLAALLPGPAGERHTAVQWSAAGFGAGASDLLGRALENLALGDLAPSGLMAGRSSASTTGSTHLYGDLQPGSSVAAVLIRGDTQLAAFGTVTDRHDENLLAFGHPLFSLGPMRMPMASAEVLTVVSSRASSFKLSNVGPVVGAFDQDREAGLRGRIGLEAPMIPVRVKLRGLADQEYRMEVADIPQLMPNMVAVAALGALEVGTFPAGPQGLDLEARFQIAGHDDLVVRQNFDTNQAGIDSILYLMSFSSFLKLNQLAEVAIESVEVSYTQVDRPRTATLVGAHTDRQVVRPGERVRLHLEFQAYRGERFRRSVLTQVPENVPDGRFVVFVGDGTTMDGVRLTVERRQPQTFDQALEYLQSFSARKTLRILGLVPEQGLAVAGEVLPQLPDSVRSIFARGGPTGTPLGLAIAIEQDQELDRPIVGFERVDLEVRRR